MQPVEVVHTDQSGAHIARVAGEIDLATVDQFRAAFDQLTPGSTYVVDLTGVTFLGSAALSVLAEAHQRAGDSSSLWIVATPATRRLVELTGLDRIFNVADSVDSALESLS